MKIKIAFYLLLIFLSFNLKAQVKELNRLGQTPGGAGYNVNYDSLTKRLYVGCGTSIWVFDASDTNNIHVIAKRPLLGLINKTSVYGNVLFVAATHDGVWALDVTTPDLNPIAHYTINGDSAAYDLWRTNDTLYVSDSKIVRTLKFNPVSGFTKLATFGPSGSYCVARRGNYIAVGIQGIPKGKVSVYNKNNLSTPVASWEDNNIFVIQNLQFADRRNDIIYVCGGPANFLFTTSYFFALQLKDSVITPLDSFSVNGIYGYGQANIMNMDSRNDTLFLATSGAFNNQQETYIPMIDASGLPTGKLKDIGYIRPGLWNFDVSLMRGTPYLAMSSEWLGVLISNVSHLLPGDTLGFLETGGWCDGSQIRHDTLWVAQEGFGLTAYKLDSLYYTSGFMRKSRIFHVFKQFVSDFVFLNDTLVILSSSDLYNIKPWLKGGNPLLVRNIKLGAIGSVKRIETNKGIRIIAGYDFILGTPALLLYDPFNPAIPAPMLDSVQTKSNSFGVYVSGDTVFTGLYTNKKYCLALYKVADDKFTLLDTVSAPGEINWITKENNIIAISCGRSGIAWYKLTNGSPEQLGTKWDWYFNPQSVYLKNNYIYVADKFYGMEVFDIHQPSVATLVAECKGTGGWMNLFGSDGINVGTDGKIYLSDFNAGVIIIEPFDTTMTNISNHNTTLYNFKSSIFPNPTTDYFTLKIESELQLYNARLNIFNTTGEEIMNIPMANSTEMKINTSSLPCGFYFVTIINNNKLITTHKLIIE